MIVGVLHHGITVSDIDTSIDWYTSVLKLELVHRQRQDNEYTRTLVAVPDAVLEIAQLAAPGHPAPYSSHIIELIQYVAGRATGAPQQVNQVGVAHLGFVVTDIEGLYEDMVSAGAQFRNRPVAVTSGANKGGMCCYFHDPDGNTLELLQPPPGRLVELGLTAGLVEPAAD